MSFISGQTNQIRCRQAKTYFNLGVYRVIYVFGSPASLAVSANWKRGFEIKHTAGRPRPLRYSGLLGLLIFNALSCSKANILKVDGSGLMALEAVYWGSRGFCEKLVTAVYIQNKAFLLSEIILITAGSRSCNSILKTILLMFSIVENGI